MSNKVTWYVKFLSWLKRKLSVCVFKFFEFISLRVRYIFKMCAILRVFLQAYIFKFF